MGKAVSEVGVTLARKQEEDEALELERRLVDFREREERRLAEDTQNMADGGQDFARSWRNQYDTSAVSEIERAQQEGFSHRALQRFGRALHNNGSNYESNAFRSELAERGRAEERRTGTSIDRLQRLAIERGDINQADLDQLDGLLGSRSLSPQARARFRAEFGPTVAEEIARRRIANGQADSLVEDLMGRRRPGAGTSLDAQEQPSDITQGAELPPEERAPRRGDPGYQAPAGGQQGAATTPVGELSARYESGGRGVGFISSGRGDPGGQSYGIHQLSSASSMGAFLASAEGAPYREEFGNLRPGTAEFNRVYRQIAERDPQALADAQRNFYTRTHYEPLRTTAESRGFDVSNRAVQEALFSMSVQHGGAATIVERAARSLQPNSSVEAQIQALYRARTEYVRGLSNLPEETRSSVLDRYRREERDALAIARQGGTGAGTDVGGDDHPLWRHLSIQQRSTLLRNAQVAQRNTTGEALRRQLEAIADGQDPERDQQGRTALDRAGIVMTPNQFAGWQNRIRAAEERRQAFSGINNMSGEDLSTHVDRLPLNLRNQVGRAVDRLLELRDRDPARTVEGGNLQGADRRTRYGVGQDGEPVPLATEDGDVRMQVAPELRRVREMLRQRFPGLAIDFDPADGRAVVRAGGQASAQTGVDEAGNPVYTQDPQAIERARRTTEHSAWAAIMDARLAAQARVGIPENRRSPITQAEALDLLGVRRGMSDDEAMRAIRSAADRATDRYGPRAREVMTAALRFLNIGQDRRSQMEGEMATRLTRGERLTREDFARYEAQGALDRETRAWMGENRGLPVTGAMNAPMFGNSGYTRPEGFSPELDTRNIPDLERPAIAPSMGQLDSRAQAQGRAAQARPSQQQLDWLRQNIEERAPTFDLRFGPGAAARYLQQVEPEGRRRR